MHKTTLVYSEQLLRQAVFAFWYRTIGPGFLIALVAAALGLGVLIVRGERSWLVGVLATVFVVGIALAASLYFVHYRASLRKFQEMGASQATFCAEESSFTISSDIGTTTLQWSTVKELWQFTGVWLMLYSKAQFSTLPTAYLSPEMRDYVVQRIRAAGGKVSGERK